MRCEEVNNRPKVSVIIPIYGVEQYIEKCVRSLMEQTLEDIEYIFINDCTPDKSILILHAVVDQYPKRRQHILLVHNENKLGQAQTRRKGIMMACGEYVIHCDSDDWVDEMWLEKLYTRAKDTQSDIVWSGFDSIRNDGEIVYFPNNSANSISDFMLQLCTGQKWGSLCLHLVKREIAQSGNIIWPDWNYCEDLSLIFQYAVMANKISYVAQGLYKYRENTNSITHQRSLLGVMGNIEGEIKASLQGIKSCGQLGLSKIHKAHLLARIYKAKGRILMVVNNSHDFCKLWHKCGDRLSFIDIWRSSLDFRNKIVISLIFVNIYPYIKW